MPDNEVPMTGGYPSMEIQIDEFEADFEKYLELAEKMDIIVKDGDKNVCILMSVDAFQQNIEPHLEPPSP